MTSDEEAWSAGRGALLALTREHVARHRARLVAHLEAAGGRGLEVAAQHARVMDGLLATAFAASVAAHPSSGRSALFATGGLGRGELGLFSDLDVLFLTEAPDARGSIAAGEAFFQLLWDASLDVGHALRDVSSSVELARDDVKTATMLLDRRFIAGDASLARRLDRAFGDAMPAVATRIVEGLAAEREARHHRYGDSPFLLEPEIKHGCGALRDLDTARWALALLPAPGHPGLALDAHETEEMAAALAFYWDVRQRLHARAGRRQDRLTFEDQEEIAVARGERDAPDDLGVERFMQRYYVHARNIERVSDRVLSRALAPSRARPDGDRSSTSRIGSDPDLIFVDDRVSFSDRVRADPRSGAERGAPLRLYRAVESLACAPDPEARDHVARAMREETARASLRASPDAGATFLEMLAWIGEVPVKRGSILAELHDVGLLLAMIPEFEPVTGRVQHDVYHVYTVDVHSIAAVDRLRALLRGELAGELPVATRVAAEVVDRRRLALAVLLHDVGKGRRQDHSRLGAELAGAISERLGLSPGDVEHVRWIVLEHLQLYHWATRRDTSDPETLAEIARAIGSTERLRDLYLLTLVDLATTNPNALTPWKARLFDDLYVALSSALEGETMPEEQTLLDELQARGAEGALALVATLPGRYLLGVDADTVLAHAAVVEARAGRGVKVAMRPTSTPELAELVVVADDRPGLLADLAAVLAAHRLTITSASVHTRLGTDGRAEALDVFLVRSASPGADGPPIDARKLAAIEQDLGRVLEGALAARGLLDARGRSPSWARRKSPEVRTEIVVDNAASPHFTVLDVFTRDRPGLLHAIAAALHASRLDIVLAKVSTEGDRVTDAFYVCEPDGRKLDAPSRVSEVREALRIAIESVPND